jgi:hypothetical protein
LAEAAADEDRRDVLLPGKVTGFDRAPDCPLLDDDGVAAAEDAKRI